MVVTNISAAQSRFGGSASGRSCCSEGHHGYIPDMTRRERDMLMAWIDTNGLYYGTWNHTPHGCAIQSWPSMRASLVAEMRTAGCLECHGEDGKPFFFEEDWVNLQTPELSRLLRAPLARSGDGWGQELCRRRPVDPDSQRVRLLWNGYAHAVQPPEQFPRRSLTPRVTNGQPFVSFASDDDPHYVAMLGIIRAARATALAAPRVDMPGAGVVAGASRLFIPPSVPDESPPLSAFVLGDGTVRIQWQSTSATIGLTAEIHRCDRPEFVPNEQTLLNAGHVCEYRDHAAPAGTQYYALVIREGNQRSVPSIIAVDVPPPSAPPPPSDLEIVSSLSSIHLEWQSHSWPFVSFRVYRRRQSEASWEQISDDTPSNRSEFVDLGAETDVTFSYVVRAVSARGLESTDSNLVTGKNRAIMEPVFVARFGQQPTAELWPDQTVPGELEAPARCEQNQLDLSDGGFASFAHQPQFDLNQPLSLECWLRVSEETQNAGLCQLWRVEPGGLVPPATRQYLAVARRRRRL